MGPTITIAGRAHYDSGKGQALGTRGISDTVNAALAAAVRQAKRAAFDVRRFDITDDDVVAVGADQFRL